MTASASFTSSSFEDDVVSVRELEKINRHVCDRNDGSLGDSLLCLDLTYIYLLLFEVMEAGLPQKHSTNIQALKYIREEETGWQLGVGISTLETHPELTCRHND